MLVCTKFIKKPLGVKKHLKNKPVRPVDGGRCGMVRHGTACFGAASLAPFVGTVLRPYRDLAAVGGVELAAASSDPPDILFLVASCY